VDGFVIRVHPVTHGEFLAFLRALEADGQAELAEGFVPRSASMEGGISPPAYPRGGDGWALPEPSWADLPVFLVDHAAAVAFAGWEAARTGLPWRLPTRAEREKAARGVDGRWFPWGEAWHPEWSNTGLSFPEGPRPAPISAFPLDVSPYGVRGLAGNVSDWLHDGFAAAMEDPDGGRAPKVAYRSGYVTFAGGAWNSGVTYARGANVGRYKPGIRVSSLGFRLARSV
jgi:serine/threonine-protein kinase